MICVDASVAVKWVLPEQHSEHALALYAATTAAGEPVMAPLLLASEVANILRQRMVRENLALADARQLLSQFLAFPVRYLTDDLLFMRALELAAIYNLPAVYDAHYLAVAEQASCPLWTADRRLLRAVQGALPYVRAIGDYAEGMQ